MTEHYSWNEPHDYKALSTSHILEGYNSANKNQSQFTLMQPMFTSTSKYNTLLKLY